MYHKLRLSYLGRRVFNINIAYGFREAMHKKLAIVSSTFSSFWQVASLVSIAFLVPKDI